MKFQFNEQSSFGREEGLLDRLKVYKELDRYSYVPENEEGEVEHIFVYEEEIPDPSQEPEIWDLPTAERIFYEEDFTNYIPNEVHLENPFEDEIIILMTKEADNEFREENPEKVADNEAFMLED